MCDRVAVMYAGRIVEMADCREIFNNPLHEYTKALIGSVPKLEEKTGRLPQIEGQPPCYITFLQEMLLRLDHL